MASLVLAGDTSGSITVSAPAVAGSTTQTLVNVTGTLAPIVSGTAVASTSGTSIDFTGIPSWVKRITVIGSDVSTNGTSALLIQLGDSGGIETTGYVGGMFGNTNQTNTSTSGVVLYQAVNTAANSFAFAITFTLQTSTKWVASGTTTRNDGSVAFSSSYKALSDTLDRVRITTVNGTDTFDAGTINILYE
jgi:hypothetical protein